MVRLLRWATLLVLILVIGGIILSYPILRSRFSVNTVVANDAATVVPTGKSEVIAIATLAPTAAEVTATVPVTSVAPIASAAPVATTVVPAPAVIIETPTTTLLATSAVTGSIQIAATNTPAAVATTSLLPAIQATAEVTSSSQVNDNVIVIAPSSTTTITITNALSVTVVPSPIVVSTRPVTVNVATILLVTPNAPTPTPAPGQPPQVGEKGYEGPLQAPSVPTIGIIPIGPAVPGVATVTPVVVTSAEITPVVAISVAVGPPTTTVAITPTLAITVPVPPTPTPLPTPNGPYANTDSPLYSGPDLNSAHVGGVNAGEQLTLVGLYTEGTWYLLVNGLWLPGAVVSNVPFAVPLVFPTITPVPSATPTVTTTPLPTATVIGSPTPTPTATSLDQPVCSCTGDQYDCLGSVFASRAQAQQCFEYCFRQTGKDVHHLDPNGNGVACENLP